jgi:hypothetical protein
VLGYPVPSGAHAPLALGRAVQVDPIKPILKSPKTKRLKLKYGGPPSKFAFKFNLRRWHWVDLIMDAIALLWVIQSLLTAGAYTRPLFGST